MKAEEIRKRIGRRELRFSTTRSSGPGGQNVNKVSTKVELRFNVNRSTSLSDEEKRRILNMLKSRINSEGELLITSQSERTQMMNRKKAEFKFYKLLASALTEKRKRKSTKPTIASREKRLEKKRKRSRIKELRKEEDIHE